MKNNLIASTARSQSCSRLFLRSLSSTASTGGHSPTSPRSDGRRLSSAVTMTHLSEDDYDDDCFDARSSRLSNERKPIFIAATSQHIGKTTTSLAIMSGLHKRFNRVGFMKPVGQVSRPVTDIEGSHVVVDKDVAVMRQHFDMHHLKYTDMSPLLIPPGYTRDYIDGRVTNRAQQEQIVSAYEQIDASSDVVLCEGTGHVGVGSIVGASNAQVASWLGAKMVLVANGGLGKTYDVLELNRLLCAVHGVEVAGVVINRVNLEKYDDIRDYLSRALMENWGIPLLGCIPERPFLGCPALQDLQILLEGSYMLAGEERKLKHYAKEHIELVSTSLDCFLTEIRQNSPRTLYICDASRNDIVLGFAMEYHRMKTMGKEEEFQAALVVSGTNEDRVCNDVLEIIQSLDAPPILLAPYQTSHVMSKILDFTPKHNSEDSNRVSIAVNHYEAHINFDLLLESTGNTAVETSRMP